MRGERCEVADKSRAGASVGSAEGRQAEAARAAIAFHWQPDKQGTAWRQEGRYQRLGQTEIRASFGPVRQAGRQAAARARARTDAPAVET